MNKEKPASYVEESHKQLWVLFCNWCDNNGIDGEFEADSIAWWSCFVAGATAMYLLKQKGVY